MNRPLRIGFPILLALAGAGTSQALPEPRLSVAGGMSLPAGPAEFSDAWLLGPAIAAIVGMDAGSRVQIGAEVAFHRHRFDDEAFVASIRDSIPNVNVGGNDLDVLTFGLRAEFALLAWGTTKPFVAAGLGYDRVTYTDARTSGPNANLVRLPRFADDGFAFWVGSGLRTSLGPRANLFFEALYHAGVGDEAARFVPLRVGLGF